VSYYFPPLGMGGVQRVAFLSSHLERLGWNVTVLTVKPLEYAAYDNTIAEMIHPAVRILRLNSVEGKIPRRLVSSVSGKGTHGRPDAAGSGMSGWVMLPDNKILSIAGMLGSIRRIVEYARPAAVITSSPPPSVHLVGCYLRKYFGVKWLADYRDVWFSQSKAAYRTSLHRKLHSYLERLFVTGADRTIVVSDGHLQMLAARYRAYEDRFFLIPNGYEESMFAGRMLRSVKHSDVFRIGYCGTLNHLTYVPGMFETFLDISKSHPISVDICGVVSPQVLAEIDRIDCERRVIHLHGYIDHLNAVEFRARCDANLITLAPGMHLEVTIPGKVYETLRTLRPVIGIIPRDCSAWKLLSRFDNVTVVDASDIAGSIDSMIDQTHTGGIEIGMRAGIDQYSWDTLAHKYDQLLREVTLQC